MVFALPGDPIAALFGDRQPPQAVIDTLRSQYHLDEPFWVQYGIFLKNLFTFNLGNDFTGQPIAATLARVFPVTAMLAVEALIIQAVFGVAFGVFAGLRRGQWFDSTVLVASLVVIAVAHFRSWLRFPTDIRSPARMGETDRRRKRGLGQPAASCSGSGTGVVCLRTAPDARVGQ